MKRIVLTLVVAASALFSTAQEKCGFSEAHEYLYRFDPAARQRVQELIQAANEEMQLNSQARTSAVTNYTIPVVFHVLHLNGPENISDAQIQDQINVMNVDFAKENPDTINVVSDFQGLIGNPKIEFRLASLDPNGNCTNGITRHYDANTDWTSINFNNYIYTWDRTRYLNIYVVRDLPSGVAAYAYYPGSVPPQADGIVVKSIYVGSIGTGSPFTSRIITHEAGHWLNLQHVWGSTNLPTIACGDDGVNDTPITKGHNWCNLGDTTRCTPGVVENIQNYMEYAYCQLMFTPGQCTRMQNTLNSPTAGRNNLWSNSNLIATGVINPVTNCAPKAQFITTTTLTCVGNSLTFFDDSYNAPANTWQWSSPLASNVSSFQNGVLTFTGSGLAPVKLKVGNVFGSDSTVQQKVLVLAGQGSGSLNVNQGFENVFPDNQWLTTTPQYGSPFARTDTAAWNGTYSAWINNYFDNPNGPVAFYTPAFDLQGATGAQLYFYYAYAQKNGPDNDRLQVYARTGCSGNWQSVFTKNGATLATSVNSPLNSPYYPVLGEWQEEIVNVMPFAGQPAVYFKFEFTPDTNGAGNNFFIDDINLQATVTVGVKENQLSAFSVSPNPFTNSISLFGRGLEQVSALSLRDVAGRLVMADQKPVLRSGALQWDGLSSLVAGVYFLQVTTGGGSKTVKVLKE